MKKHIALYLLAALALAGCTNDDLFIEETIKNETEVTIDQFTVSANDYESEDSQTRSAISKDLKFSWKSGDAIGVYPEGGEQIQFPLDGGDGGNTATFDGKGWKLDTNTKYAAYYPYNSDNSKKRISGTEIPVSYRGQKQMSNGSTSHLGKYDYMVATSMSPNGNSINFDFKHVGSILCLELPIENAGTFTKLSLVAPEPVFTNSATLNVFSGELTPAALCATISMDLGSISVSAGGTLKVWMMIATADLSDKTLKLFLEDETGKEYKLTDIQGSNFIAERAYRLSSGSNTFSDVTYAELIDGPTFNETIKSLANNGASISYGKSDSKITKLVFSCNSSVTSSTEVGNGIFANYNSNGTITISTSADKILLNENSHHLFRYLRKLQAIENLSLIATSKVANMGWMFCDCSALKSLDLSSFNTNNVTNMYSMFSGCTSISDIDISSFDTQKVNNMSFMFSSCAFTSLDLSGFHTENAKYMECMFSNCGSLSCLDLGDFITKNVSSMADMFCNCTSLTNLDLSGFDTRNVTDMGNMFAGCSSLTSLDLSNFETSNVTNMGKMFQSCSALSRVDVSGFDTSKVKYMNAMFSECKSLVNLDLSNFNTYSVNWMNGMFYGCNSLKELDLSSFEANSLYDVNSMFSGCLELSSIIFGNKFSITKSVNVAYMLNNVASTSHACTIYGPSSTNEILRDPSQSGVNTGWVTFKEI